MFTPPPNRSTPSNASPDAHPGTPGDATAHMRGNDQRKHPRQSFRAWVEFVTLAPGSFTPVSHVAANAWDVSSGGLRMLTATPLDLGLGLVLLLRGDDQAATVMRFGVVRSVAPNGDGWSQAGVEFRPPPPEVAGRTWSQFTASAQRASAAGHDDHANRRVA